MLFYSDPFCGSGPVSGASGSAAEDPNKCVTIFAGRLKLWKV